MSTETQAPGLPPNWGCPVLSQIARINPPLDKCIDGHDVHVNFVPMRAVESEGGGVLRPELRNYGEVKKGYTAFVSGDVIMAKITPCMENGKTAVVPDLPTSVCFGSTEFHVLRPEQGIEPRWIANFLLQAETRRAAQRAMTGGVGQMRVPAPFLESMQIPLAPTQEQVRILDSVDELFSDIKAAVAALEAARAKLGLYRASVLKAAVEGEFTAEWRQQHLHTEPASEFLEYILGERRRRWEEEQLRKFEEKGQAPPKNWKEKYKEPVAPDTTRLPTLPRGWVVASTDAITQRITSGSRDWQRYYDTGSAVFVMAQNVRPGRFDLRTKQRVGPPKHDPSRERSQINEDDLLVTIVGANTGDACHVSQQLAEHFVCQSVALMRPVDARIAKYLGCYLTSQSGGQLHYRRYIYGAGRPHLSFDQLRMTPVLLPPVAEQESIVEAVEDHLSVIQHVENEIDAKLAASQALRHSILRHAFTGQLVPQDPNDEPVSELLKRIAAERGPAPAKKKTAKVP